jgi:hypothetical protein|tara:strand:+ start:1269 stop:1646 length:378 start_codon:yes stop_codon:yes gene_type:complete
MNSETIEEKYKYMCELTEDMSREVFELKKIVAGAQKTEELLKDFVSNLFELNNGDYSQRDIDRALHYWRESFKAAGISDAIDRDETAQSYRNLLLRSDEYIYESPDGGDTIYRRKFGKSEREKIK